MQSAIRFFLPLDLMEPFRPALIEPLNPRMFALGILGGKHFTPHGRGIHLNEAGRKLLLEQYEDRLTRPFLDPGSGHRTDFRTLLRESRSTTSSRSETLPKVPTLGKNDQKRLLLLNRFTRR